MQGAGDAGADRAVADRAVAGRAVADMAAVDAEVLWSQGYLDWRDERVDMPDGPLNFPDFHTEQRYKHRDSVTSRLASHSKSNARHRLYPWFPHS